MKQNSSLRWLTYTYPIIIGTTLCSAIRHPDRLGGIGPPQRHVGPVGLTVCYLMLSFLLVVTIYSAYQQWKGD